jgi:hypothetical protein
VGRQSPGGEPTALITINKKKRKKMRVVLPGGRSSYLYSLRTICVSHPARGDHSVPPHVSLSPEVLVP